MPAKILEGFKKAVLAYDAEQAANWAREAVREKVDPIKVLDTLTEALREVGDGYARGDLWLPDLVGAAKVMQSASPIIEKEIMRKGRRRESLGTVVIGTVYGDIHSIGKDMVSTLLVVEGFVVHDLGVNVSVEGFIDAIKKHKPNILAMSVLMTTSAIEQEKVINRLRKGGLRDRIKIIVGGGGITEEFAKRIGADGYDPTAYGGAKLAKNLLGK